MFFFPDLPFNCHELEKMRTSTLPVKRRMTDFFSTLQIAYSCWVADWLIVFLFCILGGGSARQPHFKS